MREHLLYQPIVAIVKKLSSLDVAQLEEGRIPDGVNVLKAISILEDKGVAPTNVSKKTVLLILERKKRRT